MLKKILDSINTLIQKLDKMPLCLLGIVLETIVFIPYFLMGEKSVFPWHDQLDENILTFVLSAKHFGEHLTVFPEMMNGLQASALQPFAVLFVPLYIIFSPFKAFVFQYAIVFAIAFYGMYFLVRELTESDIVSLMIAGCFSMLPFYPVYGAAVAGIPLCILGIILLEKQKHLFWGYASIIIYLLTAHAVFSGYAMCLIWAIAIFVSVCKKRPSKYSIIGFIIFCVGSVLINYQLFLELVFKIADYESHRLEFFSVGVPFGASFKSVIFGSLVHAEACQKYLLFPMVLLLLLAIIFWGKSERECQDAIKRALFGAGIILIVACLYSFFKSEWYADFKNSSTGILHYFQIDRFYWLIPALFWIEMSLCIGIWWNRKFFQYQKLVTFIITCVILLPSVYFVRDNSYFYMSVNQLNNGSNITGYISWESYYADDLMTQIEETIGRDMEEYRVVHIGMNPTPALMHGFYTLDGYSNSYPLEYKHQFRKIIQDELDKAPEAAVYFDTWGNRCYLFNSQTGISFMNGKNRNIKYENLEYNWSLLKQMDCDYIFSCGEIVDYTDYNLSFVGDFETQDSYWHVWVYNTPRT